jgi:5-methylcytosine-specific restriction endonuclease McrA
MRTAKRRSRRAALADRDGWRCALCDAPIDPQLTAENHPRAATIHHVRPLRDGGRHDRDNLLLAHRDCHEDRDNRRTDQEKAA